MLKVWLLFLDFLLLCFVNKSSVELISLFVILFIQSSQWIILGKFGILKLQGVIIESNLSLIYSQSMTLTAF